MPSTVILVTRPLSARGRAPSRRWAAQERIELYQSCRDPPAGHWRRCADALMDSKRSRAVGGGAALDIVRES